MWLPLARRGIVAAGLIVFLLALRELDAVVMLDTRIFPLRIYDKIHYSMLADEANLALLYLLWILAPALLLTLLLSRRRPAG